MAVFQCWVRKIRASSKHAAKAWTPTNRKLSNEIDNVDFQVNYQREGKVVGSRTSRPLAARVDIQPR